MKTLPEKYLAVLDKLDWEVAGYTDDGRVELEKYSPAGEDFIFCIDVEDFPDSVAEYAVDFDPDEHIAMWAEAKINGGKGIPDWRELVQDADNIDEMLQELAVALREVSE